VWLNRTALGWITVETPHRAALTTDSRFPSINGVVSEFPITTLFKSFGLAFRVCIWPSIARQRFASERACTRVTLGNIASTVADPNAFNWRTA
jgi:hypothetical protein